MGVPPRIASVLAALALLGALVACGDEGESAAPSEGTTTIPFPPETTGDSTPLVAVEPPADGTVIRWEDPVFGVNLVRRMASDAALAWVREQARPAVLRCEQATAVTTVCTTQSANGGEPAQALVNDYGDGTSRVEVMIGGAIVQGSTP